MADHEFGERPAGAPRRVLRRALSVVAGLVVLAVTVAGVAAVVRAAADARREREGRQEAEVECGPDGRPVGAAATDTRNLCRYPNRPDRQPEDHEARPGEAVRLAGLTVALDRAFMHELVLADQLALEVTLTNRDERPKTYGPSDWKVVVVKPGAIGGTERVDRLVNPARNEREDALRAGSLEQGESVRGTLVYDLPAGRYYVVFRPDTFSRARGVWQIDVDPAE